MKRLVFFIISLIFLFSSLNLTNSAWGNIGIYLVYILTISFIIIPLFTVKKDIKIIVPIMAIMYLFFLFCVISALINSDYRIIISSFMILILSVVSCIVIPTLNIDINKFIVNGVLLSHIPLIMFPLIINGFDTNPYRGIFYNPNSFGTIMATIFVIILALFFNNLENLIKGTGKKYSKIEFLLLGLILTYIFYLISLSSSRTSFLTVVISLLIGTIFLFIHLKKHKKIISFLKRGSIFIGVSSILIAAILRFTELGKALNNIFYKFEISANYDGGILSGRSNIWEQVMLNAGFFGKGKGFFSEIGHGAHNSFISILGNYGWLPLIFFLLFLLVIFYHSAKYTINNENDKYKYLPLLMVVSFITMSMGEEMIFKLNMLIMFFSFGSLLKRNKSIKVTWEQQKLDRVTNTNKR